MGYGIGMGLWDLGLGWDMGLGWDLGFGMGWDGIGMGWDFMEWDMGGKYRRSLKSDLQK